MISVFSGIVFSCTLNFLMRRLEWLLMVFLLTSYGLPLFREGQKKGEGLRGRRAGLLFNV